MFLSLLLAGCRAQLDTSRQEQRRHYDEIGVVLRRLDSLSSTIAERQYFKIEYYEPHASEKPGKPVKEAAAPAASNSMPATHAVGGGMGAVKSIEFSTERTEDRSVITAVDSVADQKTAESESRNEDKSVGARQDNGTVIGLAIVAAVAVIVYLLLKSYLKK